MSVQENTSHVKTLFSHSVYYGLGLFLNRSLSVILLPLYTDYFSAQELGVYSLIFSLWIFLNILYMFGTETSFLKFFIDAKEQPEKARIYCTTLTMISVTSAVFSAILYFASGPIAEFIRFDNIPQASFLIKILALLIFFDALSRYPLLLLRANLKAKVYAGLTAAALAINLSLNLILIIGYNFGIEAIFYAYIVSVIFTLLAGLIVTREYLLFSPGGLPKVSTELMKQLLSYGNKFIFIGIFVILISQSDRFFLKYFFDESLVGIYSANYRLASVMTLAIASFKFAWTPYFLNLAENPESKKIIANVFTYFVFIALAIFLFFSFFTAPIAKASLFGIHILAPEYWSGLGILPLILGAYFFLGLADNLNAAPFLKNKTSLLLIASAIAFAVNIILNFTLTPSLGMYGASWAILITYIIQFIALYIISQRIFPVKYHLGKLAAIFVLTLIFFAGGMIVHSLQDIAVKYILLILASLFMVYLSTLQLTGLIDLRKLETLFKKRPK
jgi:O-antigen/teichoic acid export membrane protein